MRSQWSQPFACRVPASLLDCGDNCSIVERTLAQNPEEHMHPAVVRFIDRHMVNAMRANVISASQLAEVNPDAVFVDLGCGDGGYTMPVAGKIEASKCFGVEFAETARSRAAQEKGIEVRFADLNKSVPFDDSSVDVVYSNQVIEHLHRPARFLKEIKRVLKPGGYAIISTENAASWHNIFSLVMGWQMFSSTCFCEKSGCGNPLALWRHKAADDDEGMGHLLIFSLRGLIEFAEYYGMPVEATAANGYYPLPYWIAHLDKRHGHYITIKARKPS